MATTNQTTTSLADAISKLNTFLGSNGWSTHHVPASGEFAAWKNPSGSTWITFALQWDTSSARYAGVYQWHGQAYDTTAATGTVPYDQDDDSGNGAASTANATLNGQRRIDFGASGPEELWVFEDTNYWHAVIRHSTNVYEHFGSGLLTKYNDWTGGEYAYGQLRNTANSSQAAVRSAATILLDGLSADESPTLNMEEYVATMHIEGMAEQSTEKWGVVMGNQASANLGSARNSDSRIHLIGGFRAGLLPRNFGQFAGTIQKGLVPLYPILIGYWDRTSGDVYWPLGQMPDVRGVSILNFTDEQEITIGSDTWTVFPSGRPIRTTNTTGYTGVQGIAYKQVS